MKIELDYENKIISVQGTVNLSAVVAKLQLAVDDWKEWEIQCNNLTYISHPVYPAPLTYPTYPTYPTWPDFPTIYVTT